MFSFLIKQNVEEMTVEEEQEKQHSMKKFGIWRKIKVKGETKQETDEKSTSL